MCVDICLCVYVYVCMCTYMCAKYSDFLCIWLRKLDFFNRKVGYRSDPDPNDLFRIRIRILQKVPDPTGSGSGSTTLAFYTGISEVSLRTVRYLASNIIHNTLPRLFSVGGYRYRYPVLILFMYLSLSESKMEPTSIFLSC